MKTTAVFLLLILSFGAKATSIIQHDINEITEMAGLIFQGQVVGLRSYKDSNNTIYTEVDFDVHEVVSGQHTGTTISLRYLGGTVEGITMNVVDSVIPDYGQKGIYFVAKNHEKMIHPLAGWGQGHYTIEPTASGNKVFSSNRRAVTYISSVQKKSANRHALNSYEASGVIFSPKSSHAMTPQEFKLAIQNLRK